MNNRVEKTIWGLEVSGDYIHGGWEGDPSIPNGTHVLPDYIDFMKVITPDGTDIYEDLTDKAIEILENELLEDC